LTPPTHALISSCSYSNTRYFCEKASTKIEEHAKNRSKISVDTSRLHDRQRDLGDDVESVSADVTALLKKLAGGNQDAANELAPMIYQELHRLAVGHLRHERPNHTLQPTALVHEAYLKLVVQRNADWQSRAHFLAVASNLMRRILVDYARRHLRGKRGAGQAKLSLDQVLLVSGNRSAETLALDESLIRLKKMDARQARIIELRYFGGLTVDEVAKVLDRSPTSVRREWNSAKAWLYGELKGRYGDHA
jgi:RNA polymerase sigma-70 factor, ECF subfamily